MLMLADSHRPEADPVIRQGHHRHRKICDSRPIPWWSWGYRVSGLVRHEGAGGGLVEVESLNDLRLSPLPTHVVQMHHHDLPEFDLSSNRLLKSLQDLRGFVAANRRQAGIELAVDNSDRDLVRGRLELKVGGLVSSSSRRRLLER